MAKFFGPVICDTKQLNSLVRGFGRYKRFYDQQHTKCDSLLVLFDDEADLRSRIKQLKRKKGFKDRFLVAQFELPGKKSVEDELVAEVLKRSVSAKTGFRRLRPSFDESSEKTVRLIGRVAAKLGVK